jgi:transcriptional regulator with XRE-family HTH domain
VRRATGVPACVLAKRLGVSETEVFRLEKAERERRLGVANLQRAAEALGCELVYALVPAEGSLEDLAAEEREVREAARAMAEQSRRQNRDRLERWLDVDEAARREMRKTLRKMGIRLR